ncbi:MAG: hypothetical protein ACJAUP_000532 [Cellvibrionaceae bacterium]|jgi:hypothetical protein
MRVFTLTPNTCQIPIFGALGLMAVGGGALLAVVGLVKKMMPNN